MSKRRNRKRKSKRKNEQKNKRDETRFSASSLPPTPPPISPTSVHTPAPQPKAETPWYELNSVWGSFGFLIAILLAALVLFLKTEFRWLFLIASPVLCLFLALVFRPWSDSRRWSRISFAVALVVGSVPLICLFFYFDVASRLPSTIKTWAKDRGMALDEQPPYDDCSAKFQFPNPDSYFSYGLTLQNGTKLVVERTKSGPGAKYLTMHLAVCPVDATISQFGKLPAAQRQLVVDQLNQKEADVASHDGVTQRFGFTVLGFSPNSQGPPVTLEFCVHYFIPINSDLDETAFTSAIAELDSAFSACKSTLHIALSKAAESAN